MPAMKKIPAVAKAMKAVQSSMKKMAVAKAPMKKMPMKAAAASNPNAVSNYDEIVLRHLGKSKPAPVDDESQFPMNLETPYDQLHDHPGERKNRPRGERAARKTKPNPEEWSAEEAAEETTRDGTEATTAEDSGSFVSTGPRYFPYQCFKRADEVAPSATDPSTWKRKSNGSVTRGKPGPRSKDHKQMLLEEDPNAHDCNYQNYQTLYCVYSVPKGGRDDVWAAKELPRTWYPILRQFSIHSDFPLQLVFSGHVAQGAAMREFATQEFQELRKKGLVDRFCLLDKSTDQPKNV